MRSYGIYVRAVQDGGTAAPIQGIDVKAAPATFCNGLKAVTAILLEAKTNASGMVHFDGFYGTYYEVKVTYSGQTYDLTAPMKANMTTFLSVHFPSGGYGIAYL